MSKQDIMNFKPKFYHYVFLFIVGCLLGVVVEGIFAIVDNGVWENHVTFVWGYLNIVYGAGAVMSYVVAKKMAKYNILITFVVYLILASVLEWLCGFTEEVFLNSTSWDYEALGNLTIAKYISVPFSLAWGILGILFIKFLLPPITKLFMKMNGKGWTIAGWIITVFMVVNLAVSMYAFYRWGAREIVHTKKQYEEILKKGGPEAKEIREVKVPNRDSVYVIDKKPTNGIDKFFDRTYPDEYMHNRYMEWVILPQK